MYIFNAFIRIFSGCGRRLLSVCGCRGENAIEPQAETAAEPLVRSHTPESLADGYHDFAHSSHALKHCGYHVVFYFVLVVVAFSFCFEKWSIIDSLYFGVVTFTTIGYGDLAPRTEAGKIFTICFVLYGVVIIGIFIGIIGNRVVEMQEEALAQFRNQSQTRIIHMFSKADSEDTGAEDASLEQDEETTKKTLWQDTREIFLKEAPIISVLILVALLIGRFQGWSIITSIYYGIISLTTVGFGDMHPDTKEARLLSIFFLPVMVAVFGEVLGRIASAYTDRINAEFEKAFLHREFTLRDMQAMDTDHDGNVTMGEFISFMLIAMQKVDKEDLDELKTLFHSLDVDGSGALNKEDLILLARRKNERAAEHPEVYQGMI